MAWVSCPLSLSENKEHVTQSGCGDHKAEAAEAAVSMTSLHPKHMAGARSISNRMEKVRRLFRPIVSPHACQLLPSGPNYKSAKLPNLANTLADLT